MDHHMIKEILKQNEMTHYREIKIKNKFLRIKRVLIIPMTNY